MIRFIFCHLRCVQTALTPFKLRQRRVDPQFELINREIEKGFGFFTIIFQKEQLNLFQKLKLTAEKSSQAFSFVNESLGTDSSAQRLETYILEGAV
jgi:hypothetical protein